ncbi:hypothetical protein FMM75_02920 [Lachnospiraceae bacterium MD335]|nr:hypothetical protein [Lachnospiraceae bacterium MD335]
MSEREKAIQLIKEIPDNKLVFVVDMLNSIKKLLIEEVEPDEWDLEMIAQAEQENDGTKVSFDELLQKEGLTYADLQS